MPRERDLSRILAAREGGECEVKTPVGYIDVLTPKVLYEVKEVGGWKGALGQVLAYGHYYPNHKLKLYLYGEASTKQKLLIKEHCTERGIGLAWHRELKPDEPLPPPKTAAPLADGLKLVLSARDVRYGVKAGCNENIITPTEPIARETLDAYLDEALTVFDALLDNELTLTPN